MKLNELNSEQKQQLKTNILVERGENISYGDIVNVDTLVTDKELEERFGGTEFVEEDFVF